MMNHMPNYYTSPNFPENDLLEEPVTQEKARAYREKYRYEEYAIQGISLLFAFAAALGTAGCFMTFHLMRSSGGTPLENVCYPVLMIISAVVLIPGYYVAWGLSRFYPRARVVAVIMLFFGLFIFPGGTFFSALSLFILYKYRVRHLFSPDYQRVLELTQEKQKFLKPVRLLVFMAAVLFIMAVIWGKDYTANQIFKGFNKISPQEEIRKANRRPDYRIKMNGDE